MQQASLHTGGATAVEIASSSQKLSSTKMRGKMISGVVQQIHKAKFLLNDHSTTILSAVGVAGTVGTAVLTGRASFKAADVIAAERYVVNLAVEGNENPVQLSKTEKVKLTWKLYLPPVATGVMTVTCIVYAHKISSKKIAALAVATGISERAFQEYKEKVVEKLGPRQDQKIRDDVAQDRVTANPPGSREIMIVGNGEVLFFDQLTGRYFQSTVEDVKRAENKVNFELIHYMSCSLSHFYDEVGLQPTTYTDQVGWNLNNKMEVVFSTVLSPDGRPCIAIDFRNPPVHDYDKGAWN
jgi:hypothetical protein